MSNKSPVFPIPADSHHFSDYGFDPQIDYFQVLEEGKRHKRDNNLSMARSIDSLNFKLEKPTSSSNSKDDSKKSSKWWRNVMLFLRKRLVQGSHRQPRPNEDEIGGIEQIRCRGPYVGSLSGPLYLTESRSSGGSSTPYRSSSGPASRMLTPARISDVEIPYVSLRELNMEIIHHHHQLYNKGTGTNSAMPIYLVT